MDDQLMVHIVDDDEAVRDSVAMMLEANGFRCTPYASGTEFLSSVLKTVPGCAVIDLRMPGIDGLSLQKELVAQDIHLPVIFMTGYGDVPAAVEAMKNGAVDFVQKPCEVTALTDAIRRAFALAKREQTVTDEALEARRRLSRLTDREKDVLQLLVVGDPNKIIAHKLGISARTVEIHRARVMEKAQVRSLPELVRLAIAAGATPRPAG